jgi:hypothetical protein
VREIAWKAQTRLTARFRELSKKNKRPTIVAVAIAREMCGFIWAIDRALRGVVVPDRAERSRAPKPPR